MKITIDVYPIGSQLYVFDHMGIRVLKVRIASIHQWASDGEVRYQVNEMKDFEPIYFMPELKRENQSLLWNDFEASRVHETVDTAIEEMNKHVAAMRSQYATASE